MQYFVEEGLFSLCYYGVSASGIIKVEDSIKKVEISIIRNGDGAYAELTKRIKELPEVSKKDFLDFLSLQISILKELLKTD